MRCSPVSRLNRTTRKRREPTRVNRSQSPDTDCSSSNRLVFTPSGGEVRPPGSVAYIFRFESSFLKTLYTTVESSIAGKKLAVPAGLRRTFGSFSGFTKLFAPWAHTKPSSDIDGCNSLTPLRSRTFTGVATAAAGSAAASIRTVEMSADHHHI